MPLPTLDSNLCRTRQARLRDLLSDEGLDAGLIVGRKYVHALTGYWHEQVLTPVAVIVDVTGESIAVVPEGSGRAPAADTIERYRPSRLATQVEDVTGSMFEVVRPLLDGRRRIGSNVAREAAAGDRPEWINITASYQRLRRRKDPDEIHLLSHAIRGAEAAYAVALEVLHHGITEVSVFAAMHGAAVEAIGEPLSGWGNDFQIGGLGSTPRQLPARSGEIAILDIGVGFRGYRCDLCRSFVVDATPSTQQAEAHAYILDVIDEIERRLMPGLPCRALYEDIREKLDGWQGYTFPHHLGHGIGLDPHETPRLNPEWSDVLEDGDCIAIEPALYGAALKVGIRLEHDYLITREGAKRLSAFPLDL